MTRALGNSLWICRRVSIPFRPGSWMSIRVTSGRCARNFSMASSPLEASATSFMSFSVLTSAAIPLRRSGWSSTVRIRIRLGSMLMIFQSFEEPESGAPRPPSVGYRRGDAELNLRSHSRFRPHIQLRADLLCSLSNPRQTPVSGDPAFLQQVGVHAFSIVPHAQPKLVFCVQELSFDPARLCVSEGVPQHFARDSVDLIADERSQHSGLA